jgi:hypothetical protein
MLRVGVSVGCGNRSDAGIVSSTLMVLPKLLSLIPFWRAGPALVLECYDGTLNCAFLFIFKLKEGATLKEE